MAWFLQPEEMLHPFTLCSHSDRMGLYIYIYIYKALQRLKEREILILLCDSASVALLAQ